MKGILVIGYGSSLPYAEQAMKEQCRRLAELRKEKVYYAFHRVSKPLVTDVMKVIASDGVDELLAIPYFIADGEITKERLPKEIGLEKRGNGTVEVGDRKINVTMGTPIGSVPGIVDVLVKRIILNGGKKDTPIMIIGHGSNSPELSEAVEAAAEGVRKRGYTHVEIAYNEFNDPSIEEVFPKILSAADDKVIVIPMFIACGLHLKFEIPEKLGLKGKIKGGIIKKDGRPIEVRYTPAVGEDEYLAEVLAKKAADVFDRSVRC